MPWPIPPVEADRELLLMVFRNLADNALKVSPRVVINLIWSLFLVSFHRHDLGEDAYAETMKILTDLVAGYITEGVA